MILQVVTDKSKQESVVLGIYSNYSKMISAKRKFIKSGMQSNLFFYDVKILDGEAMWTNVQIAT